MSMPSLFFSTKGFPGNLSLENCRPSAQPRILSIPAPMRHASTRITHTTNTTASADDDDAIIDLESCEYSQAPFKTTLEGQYSTSKIKEWFDSMLPFHDRSRRS